MMRRSWFSLPTGGLGKTIFRIAWAWLAALCVVGSAWAEASGPRDLAGLLESKPDAVLSLELGEEMRAVDALLAVDAGRMLVRLDWLDANPAPRARGSGL